LFLLFNPFPKMRIAVKITKNLDKNPESSFGIEMARQFDSMVKLLYGPKYEPLIHKTWDQGYKKGLHLETQPNMTPDVIAWVDKALNTFYNKT